MEQRCSMFAQGKSPIASLCKIAPGLVHSRNGRIGAEVAEVLRIG